MGKGDKKTRRGKITKGTTGNARPRKKKKAQDTGNARPRKKKKAQEKKAVS